MAVGDLYNKGIYTNRGLAPVTWDAWAFASLKGFDKWTSLGCPESPSQRLYLVCPLKLVQNV